MPLPRLDDPDVRLIGWGAGAVFVDHYPLFELQLAYTVCPYPYNQGKIIHGIEVKSPEALRQEPRDKTLVVIFSAAYEQIIEQIRYVYGDYRVAFGVAFDYAPSMWGSTRLRHK